MAKRSEAEQMSGVGHEELEVVVGWLPGLMGESLAHGSRGLAPALLYGDRVRVICPQSDDALEMQDYFDLRDALPGIVKFDALDSMYTELDATGEPARNKDGSYNQRPFAPQVWSELADRYIDVARNALLRGDNAGADVNVSKAAVLFDWGHPGDDRIVDALAEYFPHMTRAQVVGAVTARSQVHDEVISNWLLGAFLEHGTGPGRYPLLDDVAGLLSGETWISASSGLSSFARARGTEAALSAAILRTLPSPSVHEEWSVFADIRRDLKLQLRRFRAAMAELAAAADINPFGPDFIDAADQILRMKVWPALAELEELVREASFRQVFFRDVTGDLSAYAGPLIGLGTAMSDTLPALMSAAIGAVTPLAASVSHGTERRREVRRHEFFFVHEAGRRLRRQTSD